MNLLAAIIFSNPAFWIGSLALSIPVVIHLLTRRTPKNMIFPTLKFIRMAKANQSNLHRLRHILLLLLRTALILLILLVFLKPIITESSDLTSDDAQGNKTVIILVDSSASMGYLKDGVTSFSKARIAALEILDHCGAKDKVNVILMGAVPKLSFDTPIENLVIARKDIREAEPLPDWADINAALTEAVKQLDSVSCHKKEIYFISDFQRSNWSSVNFGAVKEDAQMVFIPVGPQNAANCAIISASVLPASPTVLEPVEIICKVANYGNQAAQIPVELVFKDDKILTQEVSIEPHSTILTSFRVRINEPGLYESKLQIAYSVQRTADSENLNAERSTLNAERSSREVLDGLKIDNQRFFTFHVSKKVNILLVSDVKIDDITSGSRFLDKAINPFAESARTELVECDDTTIVTSVIRSEKLDALNTASSQVIILSEINELSRENAKILIDYLRDGGSIAYFHVGGAAAHNLKLLEDVSEGDFTPPYTLSGQVDTTLRSSASVLRSGSTTKDESLRSTSRSLKQEYSILAGANFDHRILRKFKETGELGDLKFYRYFITEREKQKGQVLLSYDDKNIYFFIFHNFKICLNILHDSLVLKCLCKTLKYSIGSFSNLIKKAASVLTQSSKYLKALITDCFPSVSSMIS